ncbi:reticulon-4-like isoform X2 [Dreissena polymorpha]|uniref:reticulon-4-like isoform X2 n=1 Tax=Dreissena polymorpha TaxID=45954 RepID=UPI00226521FE|nr:reticulon-4-like isoform X2 [Dreissena polymorpha]
MSDNFNAEEFEKIDHVQADQDTNITSTSFGAEPDGDMAEEDQFGMDNGTNDDAMFTTGSYTSYSDNQGHVSSGGQPLISFAEDEGNVVAEEPETEPLKPASQKKPSAPTECGQAECPKYTGGVMGIPGCWMKNVDPRDMSSMSDQPEPLTLQKPIEGSESGASETQPNYISNKDLTSEDDSDSIISSSDNEYSSSAESSDIESSDSSCESSLEIEVSKTKKLSCHVDGLDLLRKETETLMDLSKDSAQISDSQRESVSNLEDMDDKLDSEGVAKQGVDDHDNICSDPKDVDDESKSAMSSQELTVGNVGISAQEMNSIFDKLTKDEDIDSDTCMTGGNVGISSQVLDSIFDKLTKDEDVDIDTSMAVGNVGMSAQEMDSIFDKLTKDEDIDNDTSMDRAEMPPFSMNHNDFGSPSWKLDDGRKEERMDDHDNDASFSSNDSTDGSSGNEVALTDSDVTDDDEENVGQWNPSPVYEDKEHSHEMDDYRISEDTLPGYEFVEKDTVAESKSDDTELNNLRSEVTSLIHDVEELVQDNNNERIFYPSLYPVRNISDDEPAEMSEKIEVIHDTPVEYCKSALSDPANKSAITGEYLHVSFHKPTNMIIYDPDSPIIERVSVELSEELNDSEDIDQRLKDVDVELEHNKIENIPYADDDEETEHVSLTNEDGDNSVDLEKEVVQDLKDVFGSLTAKGEISVANEIKDIVFQPDFTVDAMKDVPKSVSEIETVTELESAVMNEACPQRSYVQIQYSSNDSDQHLETDVSDESEVVLRKKQRTNDYEVGNEFDTSGYSGDRQDSLVIHDEEILTLKNEMTDSSGSNDSMVIHDDENISLETKSTGSAEVTQIETESKICSDALKETFEDISDVTMRVKKFNVSPTRQHRPDIESMIIHEIEQPKLDSVLASISDKDEDLINANSSQISEKDKLFFSLNYPLKSDIREEALEPELDSKEICVKEVMESNVNNIAECSTAYGNVTDNDVETKEKHVKEFEEHVLNETSLSQPECFINDSGVDKYMVEHGIEEVILGKAREVLECVKEEENDGTEMMNDKHIAVPTKTIESVHRHRNPLLKEKAAALVKTAIEEVLQLIYWRDVKRTGLVFGSMVCVLLSLMCCTILSVLAYLSLAVLTVTLSFRVYKNVMQAVQKTNDGHPFKSLLEMDLEVKEEMVESAASKIADNVNSLSRELRRLFLVEDYVDSIKFALLMWLMTYVGSWFNGMTLVILAVVAIFTIPKVYETYQGPIDQNVNLVRNQLNNIMAQVSSKIPFPKAKAKTQ